MACYKNDRKIESVHSQTREFQRQRDHPGRIAGEIVAFANGERGVVFFGVDDDGLFIGLPDTQTALPSLTPIGRDRCMPPLSPMLAQYVVEGRDIQ